MAPSNETNRKTNLHSSWRKRRCPTAQKWIAPHALQFPPLAVGPANESIRLGGVDGFECRRIPLKLFAGTEGHVAQVVCFGQPARILEIGAGRFSSFAGLDPLLMMT